MNRKKEENRDMKKVLPGTVIGALIVATAVFLVMLDMEKSMLSDYEKGGIVTAASDIPSGQILDEKNVDNYFQVKEIDKLLIPESALTDISQVYGMAPKTDIEKGSFLTAGMFENVNQIASGMREPVVAGFRADDLYQVTGGTLRTGDRIHIYIVMEKTGETRLVWENVFIQDVFDSSGNRILNEDDTTPAQRINILLEKEEAEMFYAELAAGSVRVVRVW